MRLGLDVFFVDHVRLSVCLCLTLSACVLQSLNKTAPTAVHSLDDTHHYEFVLDIANVTLLDLHRYDLQVSSDLGTTVGSVHVTLGQYKPSQPRYVTFVCSPSVRLSVHLQQHHSTLPQHCWN